MYSLPLLFEPGTSWSYGFGVDWAGQMVERVNNQSLDSYMQTHIWQPLGMTSTTFRLQTRPDIKSRRADMSMRAANGTIVPSPTRYFPENSPDDHGGGGVYSCPADYIKILISLLKNDGTLLKPASIDLLFSPCLSPTVVKALKLARSLGNKTAETNSQPMGGAAVPEEVDYALGGLVTRGHTHGFREVGSMSWGGLPNLSWVVDRKAGIALLYSSQLLPSGDQMSKAAFERFEGAVYSGELAAVRI
jgi:CubicO group peptidase (beta-lactamase class C family)